MSLLKLASVFLADEDNRKAISNVFDSGIKLLKGDQDQDGDGDFDEDDALILFKEAQMLVSVWGHSALSDGVIGEEEEDAVSFLFEDVILKEILTTETIRLLNTSRKEVKNILFEQFENPISLKQISKYARDMELEEVFYEHAWCICGYDEIITDDEREFLDYFADALELNRFDKRKIERK
jgi:uncharacterized membrane protein YebE (DUF533 family)